MPDPNIDFRAPCLITLMFINTGKDLNQQERIHVDTRCGVFESSKAGPKDRIFEVTLDEGFAIDVEKRIDGAAEVGRHRTSMLQDLEAGRPLEIEALLGAVVELAGWVGVETPISRAVLALVRQRAAMRHRPRSRWSSEQARLPFRDRCGVRAWRCGWPRYGEFRSLARCHAVVFGAEGVQQRPFGAFDFGSP